MNNKKNTICNDEIFSKVFNTYAKELKNFLFFKFKDLESAEDVMQDAFVKLWEKCAEVRFETVKSYLFTIGNNLFLNILKHEEIVKKNNYRHSKSITNESPEFLIIEKEYLERIETAIAGLTVKQREVFLMNRIEGLKYREIAEKLNISQKAVEKRMHKALQEMKKVVDLKKK